MILPLLFCIAVAAAAVVAFACVFSRRNYFHLMKMVEYLWLALISFLK